MQNVLAASGKLRAQGAPGMKYVNSMFLVIFAFIGGCAGAELSPTMVSDDALLIWSEAPQVGQGEQVILTAGLSGRLSINKGCIRVGSSKDAIQPVWPFGTTLITDGGRVTIKIPGHPDLSIGQEVRFSGGFSSDPISSAVVGKQCTSSLFYIGKLESQAQ
jgi:hypothetical protein